jgi:hypothetical protein
MQHLTTSPTQVVADERRFEIVHSSAPALDPAAVASAGGREGWYYRPEEEPSALTGPFPTFEQAASKLDQEIGPPDYTAFVFEDGADTAEFERTLPSDYVHAGREILVPTILGVDRLSEPRRWLASRGIPHLTFPSSYLQVDLFPSDEDDDEGDDDEIAGPRP